MKKIFLTSSQKILILIVVFFLSAFLVSNDSHPLIGCKSKDKQTADQDSILPWKYPELSSIPDDEEGKIIKLGRSIFTETYKYVGPDVKDSSSRYLGNNMDCQNCHFNAGTQQYVFGLVGTYAKYPAHDARTNKMISIQQRINDCMMRSMNGKPLPETGTVMNALVAYVKWLSYYVPKGRNVDGNGVHRINLIGRAADTANGRIIFADKCATCHAENGHGVLNKPWNVEVPADSLKGYDFPPVMGGESYNQNAGMFRLLTAAAFIFAKMPLSSTKLSLENAYDVAAYINSEQRPVNRNLYSDYPDLKLKPVDYPFSPYDDDFPESQHKYGPYQQMLKDGGKSNLLLDPGIAR